MGEPPIRNPLAKPYKKFLDTVFIITLYIFREVKGIGPSKRVIHHMYHGSKKTRKKNLHRAIKVLKETNNEYLLP